MTTPTPKRRQSHYPVRIHVVRPVVSDAWDSSWDYYENPPSRQRRLVACAACGSTEYVRPDPRCGGIAFCEDCSDRSRLLSPWDDLGGE